MRSKTRKVEGVVIGRKDFYESDILVSIFTDKEGKIRALAKGVRKSSSRRSGKLELGEMVKAVIAGGKSLDIITEVEVIDSLMKIRDNPPLLGGIIYLCELINSLLPEGQRNSLVYQEFIKTREDISQGKLESIVKFEAEALGLLGFGKIDKEEELIREKEWKLAHERLRERIERVIERPLKSLAIFS